MPPMLFVFLKSALIATVVVLVAMFWSRLMDVTTTDALVYFMLGWYIGEQVRKRHGI